MKIIKYIIPALLVISPTIFANCPAPQTMKYTCNQGHCSWAPKDGWYEGTNPNNYTPANGTKGVQFTAAKWSPYSGPRGGATTCYYQDSYGDSITLFQQTMYGEVPKPLIGPWELDPTNASQEICTATAETCHFDYGEQY